MNQINHFSINDLFWITIQNNFVSFGYKELPKNIHFTLSFSENSSDVNLHITKNTPNENDKPNLRIFEIDKKILEEDIENLSINLLNTILEKIDIINLQEQYETEIGFISFENIEKSELGILTQNKFIESFKTITKIKNKTRLKINGNLDESFEKFSESGEIIQDKIINNIVNLNSENIKEIDGGIIIAEDNIINVIRINNCWFKFRTDVKPLEIISSIINPHIAKILILKIKNEIKLIEKLNSKSESKVLSKPIRLVR